VNVRGTLNLLELAKEWGVRQFVFASSSSVYGANPNLPWREDNPFLLPISPYGATKLAGETLERVYSQLYSIRFIALRIFTAYGARQRPDLAIHKFARLMLEGKPHTDLRQWQRLSGLHLHRRPDPGHPCGHGI